MTGGAVQRLVHTVPEEAGRRTAPLLRMAALPVRTPLSCLFFHPCLLHPASLCFWFHLPNTTSTQILVHDLFLEKSKLRQLERKIKSSLASLSSSYISFTLPSH